MKRSDLIGVWKLIRYVSLYSNKEVIYPYGSDALGYLIYTSDNYMSINIMRSKRSLPLLSNDSSDINIHRNLEMANNYGGYAGRYEIIGEDLFHYPEVCKMINYLHIPQKKAFHFVGNRLIIKYQHPIEFSQQEQDYIVRSKLVWEKSIV